MAVLISQAYDGRYVSSPHEPSAFEKDCYRLLYLIAVGKPCADLAKSVAKQGLEAIGRETCPYTGQHYFAEYDRDY